MMRRLIRRAVTFISHRRAILAALLAVIYPGLGHAYLRAWGRALLWFGAVVMAAVFLIPTDVFTSVSTPGDVLSAWEAIPIEAAMGIAMIAVFNVIDAYWTGRRMTVATDELRCPSCGRALDEDISFCHWCTTEYTVETN